MGLLDQILGGLTGGMQGQQQAPSGSGFGGSGGAVIMALLPIVLNMLSNRGGGTGAAMGGGGGMAGLDGLLQQLTQSGYGRQADSWVGTGTNEPVPPDAWSSVLPSDQLSAIASQAGISEDEARHGLSELVPDVVDRLTPQGQLPPQDELLASIDRFASRLGR
jgi:uncharacterized protein YidB (DUF937 family)